MKTKKTGLAATTLATLALGACNDGAFVPEEEGGADNVSLIEGAYGGFLSGVHSGSYYRLLLSGTDMWLAYGTTAPLTGFQASGFFHSSGAIDGKTYTGTSAIEYFGQSPNGTGTASAIYDDAVEPPLLNGSYTIAGSSSSFTAGPIAGANFDYGTQALLAGLGGSWQVVDLAGASHQLVVDGINGTFTLDVGAPCEASGQFTPVENRNSYTGTITFGNGCASSLQNKTLNGVGLIYANQAPVGVQLIAMFRDDVGNSVGYALNGVR